MCEKYLMLKCNKTIFIEKVFKWVNFCLFEKLSHLYLPQLKMNNCKLL
jgi:hypothetical protein